MRQPLKQEHGKVDTFERPLWSRRTFQFGHPEWMLADFIERLRGTAVRLTGLLTHVSEARAHAPVEGSWSIAQHAGHLADVEELWQQRCEDLRAGRAILTPARGPYFTELAGRHVGRPIPDILDEFAHRRQSYIEALTGADTALQSRRAYHERLQCDMRLVDGAQFVAEHDDHHLLRIRALLGTAGGSA